MYYVSSTAGVPIDKVRLGHENYLLYSPYYKAFLKLGVALDDGDRIAWAQEGELGSDIDRFTWGFDTAPDLGTIIQNTSSSDGMLFRGKAIEDGFSTIWGVSDSGREDEKGSRVGFGFVLASYHTYMISTDNESCIRPGGDKISGDYKVYSHNEGLTSDQRYWWQILERSR